MKGFAMKKIGKVGWIEKDAPRCGPLDAICRPIALAPCTSDIHTVYEGALGEREDLILGHEAVGEIVEVGALVKDFKVCGKVLVSAITPDWGASYQTETLIHKVWSWFLSRDSCCKSHLKSPSSAQGAFPHFVLILHIAHL